MSTFIGAVALTLSAPSAQAQKARQQYFASPAEAVATKLAATKSNDEAKLQTIFGPGGGKLINSGDTVADARRRKAFAANYESAKKLRMGGESRAVVLTGKDEWPMRRLKPTRLRDAC